MSFQLAALAGRAHDPIDIWNLIFQQGIDKLVYDEGLFLLHVLLKTLKYKFKCFRGVDFKIHAFYSPSNCIAKGVTQKRFLQPSTVGPHDSPSPGARPVSRRPWLRLNGPNISSSNVQQRWLPNVASVSPPCLGSVGRCWMMMDEVWFRFKMSRGWDYSLYCPRWCWVILGDVGWCWKGLAMSSNKIRRNRKMCSMDIISLSPWLKW